MAGISALIAVILFALAAFGVKFDSLEIVPLGLAFLALALVLSSFGWSTFNRNP